MDISQIHREREEPWWQAISQIESISDSVGWYLYYNYAENLEGRVLLAQFLFNSRFRDYTYA
jgi:hypothetical protein